MILISLTAPWISPYDPNDADMMAGRLAPAADPRPTTSTDGQARDILSRLIWGGRVSLPIAALPILASSILGLALGLIAGWLGGPVRPSSGACSTSSSPSRGVLLAVAVAAILGPGMMNAMLAMSIVVLPYVARIVYVETINLRDAAFIEAARVCGMTPAGIVIWEVLPNVLSPVIVYGTTSLGALVVFAAGLSFPWGRRPATDRGLGHHGVERPRGPDLGALGLADPRYHHRDCRGRPQFHGRWLA